MSYLDVDSCMLASSGYQSAKNFLLLDELPSPLDACGPDRGAPRGGVLSQLPAPGLLLPLPEDDPTACAGMQPPAMHHNYHHAVAAAASQQQPHHHPLAGGSCREPAFGPAAPAPFAPAGELQQLHAWQSMLTQQQQQQQQQPYYQQQLLLQQQYTHMQQPAHAHALPQPRRVYQLVLLDDATGRPLRTATDDDAAHVARMLESDSGSSGLSATASLPRAMSFVGSAGAVAAMAAAAGNEEEEVGEEVGAAAAGGGGSGGGARDQGNAKRRNSGKAAGGGSSVGARSQQEGDQRQQRPEGSASPAQLLRAQAPKPAAEKRTGPCMHCGVDESPQWRKGPPHKSVLCNACGTRWRRTHQLGPPVASSVLRAAGAAGSKRKAQEFGGDS
ncbi:hypothetical protein MNEG_1062 [Monoraphidium neglectum]|uniref:GATA-type domain-containing protein n=1 Tax=Monoraphidium neglectum TaxID=145388 RepID=A0A0D2LKF6_9CHLO|nr:hypothetical protein MNEG_1062 [Monoraphidium neglectum]KIZ06889.1 hypothetical protein MNEG_1062 [Monoraphidium neglectum]|eukprot:XP_013905908.1 hypothetical protein MNEG_1062 [Monoraphidium neglectum]